VKFTDKVAICATRIATPKEKKLGFAIEERFETLDSCFGIAFELPVVYKILWFGELERAAENHGYAGSHRFNEILGKSLLVSRRKEEIFAIHGIKHHRPQEIRPPENVGSRGIGKRCAYALINLLQTHSADLLNSLANFLAAVNHQRNDKTVDVLDLDAFHVAGVNDGLYALIERLGNLFGIVGVYIVELLKHRVEFATVENEMAQYHLEKIFLCLEMVRERSGENIGDFCNVSYRRAFVAFSRKDVAGSFQKFRLGPFTLSVSSKPSCHSVEIIYPRFLFFKCFLIKNFDLQFAVCQIGMCENLVSTIPK